MALLHPHDHAGAPRSHDGPHPALCLGAGFGVIVVLAIAVHVILHALL